ncbi:MAG: DUF5063 domain-containing protein [Sphingobacteriales bacterium]|nr:MAG: DUF5063 domain-containing protein [Sphingobacteriales bacterium]
MESTLSDDLQNFLQEESTQTFLANATKFVQLIENQTLSKEQFFTQSHEALIDLYTAGQKLKCIPLKYSGSEYECEKMDEQLFNNKNANMIAELGNNAFYWETFNPTYLEIDGKPGLGWTISDREPSQGWLVTDFADIYRDLKIGLEKIKLNNNAAVEDSLWELHFGFYHHWGGNCINALRALHYIWYDSKLKHKG